MRWLRAAAAQAVENQGSAVARARQRGLSDSLAQVGREESLE